MEENKKRKYLLIAGPLVLFIALIGITYAFFNYTRTGTANTIKVGRIAFTSDQGTPINLTNMFPIEPTVSNLADPTKVGTVTIDVSGDTTYNQGVEYLVTAVNVSNTVGTGANQKTLPISIAVTYEAKTNKVIGTEDSSYFADRGSTTSYYKVLSSDTISDGDRLLVGYIKPDNTGIDGTITIKAYLDSSKVAISDTYDGTESDNMGTTTNWVNNRVVLTTEEWNSLQANGVSFQVRIEANEGIWVKEQIKYNANGGTVSPAYKEIDDDATTYGTLATPTRGGYTFDGWFTDSVNGTEVTASTSYTQGTSATTLYAHWSLAPICIRATTLNTETCTQSSNYCYADGYYAEGSKGTTTITYGNLGTSGNTPVAGDAFDCDVDGTGYNQRFYYVSPYYNTDTKTFDGTTSEDYATLIYYSNTVSGVASTNGSAYATQTDLQTAYPSETFTSYDNCHGPVTAKGNLPTTSQWSNITLKTTERAILAEYQNTHNATATSGGTLPTAFSYEGYAARLLTAQELMRGCNLTQVGSSTLGELSGCNFLFEGTQYADSSKGTYGPWLETPRVSSSGGVWIAIASARVVSFGNANSDGLGARPVIDVPYGRIAY